jgi:hypothetical protein
MLIVKFAEKPRRSSVFQRLVCGDRRLIQLNFVVRYSLPQMIVNTNYLLVITPGLTCIYDMLQYQK